MQTWEQWSRECRAFFEPIWPQRPLVMGDGCKARPPLMLIGEAPGEQESLQGKPFVGKAGKNLTEFVDALGLKRGDLYISNVVKVRPTKQSAAGNTVNRPPNREEIELFTPWLMREIALVRPHALVTLGNVALGAFCAGKETIGACHGQWRRAVVCPPKDAALTLPLFPLYHPASVIYRRELLATYQEDLRKLAETLTSPHDI
ncbi:MAG: uracil-DNA glycosylase [Eubacteriales bacterium]|nr:uracil-DNA glycosylase [Eubacteriales bacterium]